MPQIAQANGPLFSEYEELIVVPGYKQAYIESKKEEFLLPTGKHDFETLEGEVTFIQYIHDDNSEIVPYENRDILNHYLQIAKNNEGGGVYKDVAFASYKAVFKSDKVCFAIEIYGSGTSYSLAVVKVGDAPTASVSANTIMATLKTTGRIAMYFNFGTGESGLTEASQRDLYQVVRVMQAMPDLKLQVEGHTDNVGTEEQNMALSWKRANTIKQFLAMRGIHPSRVIPQGFGATKPVASNDTEEGRNQNRRVELVRVE
jgi:outer membrane protein OmpA-like peptidoglycan-associated protein